MAPKKQNAFMVFVNEWRRQNARNMDIQQAISVCGSIWSEMSQQERVPYKEAAKGKARAAARREPVSCLGVPLKQLERVREEAETWDRNMKKFIDDIVSASVECNEYQKRTYFFISVNYFAKTLDGLSYLPAEISVSEYSLKRGVFRKHHVFVNPGENSTYGLSYDIDQHTNSTHKLPVPPKALGSSDLPSIYLGILEFITSKNNEIPPVYTAKDSQVVVEKVLEYLRDGFEDELPPMPNVFHIEYLFYAMKEASTKMADVACPSIYVTNNFFHTEFFMHNGNMACEYHEEIDRENYCTKSCVIRWGYEFTDYIGRDIHLDIVPGVHVPIDTDVNTLKTNDGNAGSSSRAAESRKRDCDFEQNPRRNDKESVKKISPESYYYDRSTAASEMKNSSKYFTDECESAHSSSYVRDKIMYPSGSRKQSSYSKPRERPNIDDSIDYTQNPWQKRSQTMGRMPETSHFELEEHMVDDDEESFNGRNRGKRNQSSFDADNDSSSFVSAGRGIGYGRGLSNRGRQGRGRGYFNNDWKGHGRGNLF